MISPEFCCLLLIGSHNSVSRRALNQLVVTFLLRPLSVICWVPALCLPFFSFNLIGSHTVSCRVPQAITALGFKQPTPIQKACIPVGLLGRDLCACAATGTGDLIRWDQLIVLGLDPDRLTEMIPCAQGRRPRSCCRSWSV